MNTAFLNSWSCLTYNRTVLITVYYSLDPFSLTLFMHSMHLDWDRNRPIPLWFGWTEARMVNAPGCSARRSGRAGRPRPRNCGRRRYIRGQFEEEGLEKVQMEAFELATWDYEKAEAVLTGSDLSIDLLPFNPLSALQPGSTLVDAGYGTPRELEACGGQLAGGIAVMHLAFEPFTTPEPHSVRLQRLADAGAAAAVCIDPRTDAVSNITMRATGPYQKMRRRPCRV